MIFFNLGFQKIKKSQQLRSNLSSNNSSLQLEQNKVNCRHIFFQSASFHISFIERHSCEVISDSISEFIFQSQLDDDDDHGGSDSVLIMIHANHLQVQSHLARGDVNSARIASAEAKKYALIAVCIGAALFVFAVLSPIIIISTLRPR